MSLPKSTVYRLSKYRRFLSRYLYVEKPHVFSHDLARMTGVHPVQVRRDLMLIGISGNHRKGYRVDELINLIDNTLDHGRVNKVCLVGIGKLGRAILHFMNETDNNLLMKAAFDLDPSVNGTDIEGFPAFHITHMDRVIKDMEIDIAVLTTPPDDIDNIVKLLVSAGIKGILNFAPAQFDVPEGIYVKECDVITYIDEIGYYIDKG